MDTPHLKPFREVVRLGVKGVTILFDEGTKTGPYVNRERTGVRYVEILMEEKLHTERSTITPNTYRLLPSESGIWTGSPNVRSSFLLSTRGHCRHVPDFLYILSLPFMTPHILIQSSLVLEVLYFVNTWASLHPSPFSPVCHQDKFLYHVLVPVFPFNLAVNLPGVRSCSLKISTKKVFPHW